MVDVGAIGQKQIGNGVPVIVIAESLNSDFPAEHYLRRSLLAIFLLRQRTLCKRVYNRPTPQKHAITVSANPVLQRVSVAAEIDPSEAPWIDSERPQVVIPYSVPAQESMAALL